MVFLTLRRLLFLYVEVLLIMELYTVPRASITVPILRISAAVMTTTMRSRSTCSFFREQWPRFWNHRSIQRAAVLFWSVDKIFSVSHAGCFFLFSIAGGLLSTSPRPLMSIPVALFEADPSFHLFYQLSRSSAPFVIPKPPCLRSVFARRCWREVFPTVAVSPRLSLQPFHHLTPSSSISV